MSELPRPLPPPSWRERIQSLDGRQLPVGLIVVAAVVAVGLLGAALILRGGVGSVAGGAGGADVALSLPKAQSGGGPGLEAGDAPTRTTAPKELRVHAAGAVAQPGVVTVAAGARVADVVAAAGGPAPDADLDQVNLAAPVTDGERVYVPHQGEAARPPVGGGSASGVAAAGSDGIVNINTADATALEELPGVGPATAQAIIDYRTEHGPFRSVDDLLNVRGIGAAKLSQIKPHARV